MITTIPATQTAFVYLVLAENGLYKIGRSLDATKRLDGLQTGSPVRLSLVHTIETSHSGWLEKYLHKKYKGRLELREWYRLTDEDVAAIKALSQDDLERLWEQFGEEPKLATKCSQSAIGQRLVSVRENAGMSSAQLARKAGVSLQMLRKIETGAQADPRVSVLARLAKALSCPLASLIE